MKGTAFRQLDRVVEAVEAHQKGTVLRVHLGDLAVGRLAVRVGQVELDGAEARAEHTYRNEKDCLKTT